MLALLAATPTAYGPAFGGFNRGGGMMPMQGGFGPEMPMGGFPQRGSNVVPGSAARTKAPFTYDGRSGTSQPVDRMSWGPEPEDRFFMAQNGPMGGRFGEFERMSMMPNERMMPQ